MFSESPIGGNNPALRSRLLRAAPRITTPASRLYHDLHDSTTTQQHNNSTSSCPSTTSTTSQVHHFHLRLIDMSPAIAIHQWLEGFATISSSIETLSRISSTKAVYSSNSQIILSATSYAID
ncbi:uncharacterized protein MYCFIDRAFT_209415 [Pseudocercospora fijiensis CIRAD86]|uniref:Uncharacterized protein n=1 Tax=Pseudocercospora fijiensis (strain CIRAD86) TaxID=383855 RepID=M2ZXK3_PSEFD|nr:uncharacterized protein MYCFIDRAFT_209415 [Pseudocercospora fijiensis CIRAD86]EME76816.1 hypothetical protein MYCFIDRAFT_209415 [Pseudocercospora fijiensis CIRAD86]